MGLLGGLVLIWKKDIEVRVSELNPIFIAVKIKDNDSNIFWRTLFAYGEPSKELRNIFYDTIISKISNKVGPLLCIGDWNYIWDRNDKEGVITYRTGVLEGSIKFWMMVI